VALTTGSILKERYRIDRRLAAGGMGVVYAAWDLNLGQACAIKENRIVTDSGMQYFEREARLLAGVRHSHLPNVVDYFSIPGQGQYLVMSFIEGIDLKELMEARGALDEARVIGWAIEILNALDYLHQRNIIHRDIKPTNIKITPDGEAVLVDFGIAKDTDSLSNTISSAARGTPGFSPPEQYRSRTDLRSDIYALGATLYVMLTGILPADALTRLLDPETYVPLSALPLNLNPMLVKSIDKALALDPRERFASAQEMLAGLRGEFAEPVMAQPVKQGDVILPGVRKRGEPAPIKATDSLKTAVLSGAETTKTIAPATVPLRPKLRAVKPPEKARPDWLVRGGVAALGLLLLMLLCLVSRPFWLGAVGAAQQSATSTLSPATQAAAETAGISLVDAAATNNSNLGLATNTAEATREAGLTPTSGDGVTAEAGIATREANVAPVESSTATPSTRTATSTGTITATTQSSATLPPSATATQGPTITGTQSATPTRTATGTATATLAASATNLISATPSATATRTATFTATFTATASATATATLAPTATSRPTLGLNPGNTSVVVGASTNMTVTINSAQSSDLAISLSSSSGAVTVPGSVVIPAGATSFQFSAQGFSAGSSTVTASLAGSNPVTSTVTVNKADVSMNISANPNPATVGQQQQVTVSFGTTINAPGSGSLTGSVTISDGSSTICTASPPSGSCNYSVSSTGGKTLIATYSGDSNFNGSSASTGLNVNSLGISLSADKACSTLLTIQMTVTISTAEAGSTAVGLSSSSGSITVPSSVNIGAGSTSATFTATSLLPATGTITATLPGGVGGNSAQTNIKFALPLIGC